MVSGPRIKSHSPCISLSRSLTLTPPVYSWRWQKLFHHPNFELAGDGFWSYEESACRRIWCWEISWNFSYMISKGPIALALATEAEGRRERFKHKVWPILTGGERPARGECMVMDSLYHLPLPGLAGAAQLRVSGNSSCCCCCCCWHVTPCVL